MATWRRSPLFRHEPEHTVLYRIVPDTLETFLAEARDRHERGLPAYQRGVGSVGLGVVT
jgi:hypothetical protein